MERNSIQGAEESPRERGVRPPLRIMFLGRSGVGKSASANTIFGRSVFRSEIKLKQVTKECQMEIHRVNDREITVIDTVGFFELSQDNEEIVENVLKFLRRNQPGPHVFLLVLTLRRVTQEDKNLDEVIERYFGPKVWEYTILLFTHGDNLEGKPLVDVVRESDKNQRDIIRKCAGGYCIFNNKDKEDQSQVTKLLEKIDSLVAVNGGEPYPIDLYPEQEQKIWALKADYMKMKDKRITSEEKKLQSQFKGQMFEEKKAAQWKKEEELACQYAESRARDSWIAGVRPPLRIMFLGRSGVGKSASANTIFGRSVFRSEMTLKCQMEIHRVIDREITVIDTVGFFKLSPDNEEIVENILKFLRRNQPGPHVFLLVLTLPRVTQEDKNLDEVIERYFGPKVWQYTILLFTHGDNLEGKPLKEVITENDKNLRGIIRKCAGGYCIFNNKEKEDQSQVTKLLEKIDTLLAVNGGEPYPIDLYPEQEQKIWALKADYMKKHKKRIASAEEQLQSQFKGQMFEEKKAALWKKEEELAWQYAEYWIDTSCTLQ